MVLADGLGSMRSFERFNANGPAGGRQLTMGKVSAALDYQRRQQVPESSSSPTPPSVLSTPQSTETYSQSAELDQAGQDPLEGVTSLRDLDPAFEGAKASLADAVVGPAALQRRKSAERDSRASDAQSRTEDSQSESSEPGQQSAASPRPLPSPTGRHADPCQSSCESS